MLLPQTQFLVHSICETFDGNNAGDVKQKLQKHIDIHARTENDEPVFKIHLL